MANARSYEDMLSKQKVSSSLLTGGAVDTQPFGVWALRLGRCEFKSPYVDTQFSHL